MGTHELSIVLRVAGLRIGHGSHPIADRVDFDLHVGEVAALIGLNGSGKSTLLNTLAGLHAPLSGSVELHGASLLHLSAKERARLVSVVLPNRPRTGMLTVRGLVELGRQPWTGRSGRLRDPDEQVVDAALEAVDMKGLAGRTFDSLSDGEAQKALVARAVAQDAPLLLLDEPTAHLDLVNRVSMLQLLRGIASTQRKAILLSLHDLAAALDLCDRILLLHEGRLWIGNPQEAISSGRLAAAFEREGMRFDGSTGGLRPR